MPRSAATAVRFDAGWDWTDARSRSDEQRDLAYYDWSLDEDFAPRRPRLRAVPHGEVRERTRRRAVADDQPRAQLVEPPSAAHEALPPIAAPTVHGIEAPVIDPVIDPVTGRRTITITGRGAERGSLPRRSSALPTERVRHKPDRIAMWAVLLCVLMILAAATSAHAAMLH